MQLEQRNNANAGMSLGDHLEELRRRLILAMLGLVVGAGIGLFFGRDIIELLTIPFVAAMPDAKLAVLKITAGFITYFRVSLIAGLMISSPWIYYQLWMFVAAGLHAHEKRYVYVAVPMATVLFVCGALFFVGVVAEQMLLFFTNFNAYLGIEPVITLGNHIGFMTNMMFVFGMGFQTPLVVFVLAKLHLVTVGTLNKYRRHVIVAILILAAAFTSPSPIDQIALAVPMWLLYELGVLLAYLFVSRPERMGRRNKLGE